MRIAQIAPLFEAVPPAAYGGTERVVSFLTEELVRLGHDVTLFASGDSVTSGRLVAPWPRPLRLSASVLDSTAPHVLLLELVYRERARFDILHFHLDYWPFPLFSRQTTPFVTTLHGRLDLPELWPVFRAFEDAPLVSISAAQRRPMPWGRWMATIPHGLPESLLTPMEASRTYLAFLGRIAPEKRVDRAVDIAGRCGLPLRVAAKVDPVDRTYYERDIRPLFRRSHVEYLSEITDLEKAAFLSAAAALVLPGDWPEPFGLVMIEAMACGTPVIAFDHGSVREIVEDGVTGFIVTDVEEAVRTVARLPRLSSAVIRRRFEERFTVDRMAEAYVGVYHQLLSGALTPCSAEAGGRSRAEASSVAGPAGTPTPGSAQLPEVERRLVRPLPGAEAER
jgi:glycosyltransferase involved in cell wall biosynthesis